MSPQAATYIKEEPSKRTRSCIYMNVTLCKYNLVRECAEEKGWKTCLDEDDIMWNIYWTDKSVSLERTMLLKPYQKINHFPGMSEISKKTRLARNLKKMHKCNPDEYQFFPKTWVLPGDYNELMMHAQKRKVTYIVKPDNSSQGKGIYLTKSVKNINRTQSQVIQEYISKPMLIDGYKFDLRLYVLVLSIDPLRIYIYRNGLVRLCTKKYLKPMRENLGEACMHLTNYSINKKNDDFVSNDGAEFCGNGSKRSLSWFLTWLRDQERYDVNLLWDEMTAMIIKTIITVQPHIARLCQSSARSQSMYTGSFEILGFDVLIDEKLHPWLIEVNHSPSFQCDSPLDYKIKHGLISNVLELLNIHRNDRVQCERQCHLAARSRLYRKTSAQKKTIKATTQCKRTRNDTGNFEQIFPVKEKEDIRTLFASLLDVTTKLFQEDPLYIPRRLPFSQCRLTAMKSNDKTTKNNENVSMRSYHLKSTHRFLRKAKGQKHSLSPLPKEDSGIPYWY